MGPVLVVRTFFRCQLECLLDDNDQALPNSLPATKPFAHRLASVLSLPDGSQNSDRRQKWMVVKAI